MSNSFTSTPTLVDPSRLTATQTIRTTEIARLADLQNHCFAICGTHNILSQTYDDSCFVQDSTSFVEMSKWYIPMISQSHDELKIRVNAFCGTAGAQLRFTLSFAFSANTYTDTVTITDTARYSSAFNVATISITNTETEQFAILTLEAKAPTGDEVEVLGVQASWTALASPLSAGKHYIGTDEFVPVGQSRQGADLPLSSRFGVQSLSNIATLRKRGRVLLCWSGVSNASSTSGLSLAANPPIGLGYGDQTNMSSVVALPLGMNEIDGLNITLFLFAVGLSGSNTIVLEIFNHRLTVSTNGWSSFDLQIVGSELSISDEFGLSMFSVGVHTSDNNARNLLSINKLIATNAYISSISIIGV
jgi:hypothetical protein